MAKATESQEPFSVFPYRLQSICTIIWTVWISCLIVFRGKCITLSSCICSWVSKLDSNIWFYHCAAIKKAYCHCVLLIDAKQKLPFYSIYVCMHICICKHQYHICQSNKRVEANLRETQLLKKRVEFHNSKSDDNGLVKITKKNRRATLCRFFSERVKTRKLSLENKSKNTFTVICRENCTPTYIHGYKPTY